MEYKKIRYIVSEGREGGRERERGNRKKERGVKKKGQENEIRNEMR